MFGKREKVAEATNIESIFCWKIHVPLIGWQRSAGNILCVCSLHDSDFIAAFIDMILGIKFISKNMKYDKVYISSPTGYTKCFNE